MQGFSGKGQLRYGNRCGGGLERAEQYSENILTTEHILRRVKLTGAVFQAKRRISRAGRSLNMGATHLARSTFFAASSSCRFCSSTLGDDNLRLSSVSTKTVEITSRVNHLLSAGTTYHGASSLDVFRIMSSKAC